MSTPCRHCGRSKEAHDTPPFEYAALLAEQQRCWNGYSPADPPQQKEETMSKTTPIEFLAKLALFAGHKYDCDFIQPMWHQGPCDCGLHALLKSMPEEFKRLYPETPQNLVYDLEYLSKK